MAVLVGRAADHVGRIGALAVALGVGAAIVTGHGVAGVALADESTSATDTSDSGESQGDSTSSSESSTDDKAPSSPASQVGGNGDVREDPSETKDDPAEEDDEQHDATDDDRDSRRTDPDDDEPSSDPSPQSSTSAQTVTVAQTEEPDVEVPDVETQPIVQPDPPIVDEPADEQRTLARANLDADPVEPAPANVITSVLTAVLAPLANTGDVPAPADLPVAGMLAAAARREIGGALVDQQQQAGFQILAAHATVAEEPVFTGQPSLITQVFVAGLRLIKPILGAFGIELNGTSARIPFFTDGVPPFFVTYGLNVRSEDYNGWKVWTLAPKTPSEKVVVAVHGGSFISTASLFHWSTYADLARATDATVVVPLYPLANAQGTGGTAKTVVPVMADFIAAQVAEHGAENVSVLGDSAGGSIALAAAQELVRGCNGDQQCLDSVLPGRMVLLSPALDSSLSNPEVADVDDPLLSPASSKRNGLWWSKGLETAEDPDGTRNPLASPLFGSLAGLPPTAVYAGSLDLRTPDVLLLQEKAAATPGADFTFELRAGQIHDWTIFGFLPDAHAERPNIYRDLGLIV